MSTLRAFSRPLCRLDLSCSLCKVLGVRVDRCSRTRKYSSYSYVVESPHERIQPPCHSLVEFIWKDVDKWSDRVAIHCADTGRGYKYGHLRKLCRRFAIWLKENKFSKNEVLSIVLPNVPEYPLVLLGTLEAGLIATTLNPSFSAEEISRQIENCGSSVVVTLASLRDHVLRAKKLIEKRKNAEFPLTLITLKDQNDGNSNFENTIVEKYDHFELGVDVHGDDIALMPYSSGTTGFPKGVQLTHSNVVHNLLQLTNDPVKYVEEAIGDFQEVVPVVIPFFNIFGISAGILTSLMMGSKIVSIGKFSPTKYLEVIENEKATVLYLAPTLSLFLTSHPSVKPSHFETIRSSFFAGGFTSVETMEKFIQFSDYKMKIRHGYGLTEASPAICVSTSYEDVRSGSVGPPLANTTIKIIGFDGVVKNSHQRGEICAKGPQVMKGYFNNTSATAATIDEEGYLHTGDVGYYNDQGNIFYIDRIKELIKVKGFQVPPAELESILTNHEAVNDVGVIGVPDQRCGEKPVAFVVLNDRQNFQENDLKLFVASQVAPYKQLGRVIFTDCIPRNPSGKILRRLLREKYEDLR